jgi:hypothetical protein
MNKLIVAVAILLLAGCANMDARQVLLGPTPIASAELDLTALQAAEARASVSKAAVPSYVHEGQAAAIMACTLWFKTISDYEEIGSLQMQEYNVLASLGMTAAGLAGANSVIVASLGALNTGINSIGALNLRAALAPAGHAVQEKVLATMTEQIVLLEPSVKDLTYPQARIEIAKLARTCTPPVIRDMTAQSLRAVDFVNFRGQGLRAVPAVQ